MKNWIKFDVNDKNTWPPHEVTVLIWNGGWMELNCFNHARGGWSSVPSLRPNITHWASLPDPPISNLKSDDTDNNEKFKKEIIEKIEEVDSSFIIIFFNEEDRRFLSPYSVKLTNYQTINALEITKAIIMEEILRCE